MSVSRPWESRLILPDRIVRRAEERRLRASATRPEKEPRNRRDSRATPPPVFRSPSAGGLKPALRQPDHDHVALAGRVAGSTRLTRVSSMSL
jgi:hypothetical protein